MPSLFVATFAIAGTIAAAAPLVIHLLNRRRFRVVEWAAMDFLRQAMQRSRKIMHLRDILLLILRTACVLLFGLAMARPYWQLSGEQSDPNQPVHAIVAIDNSLSMSYQRLDGTLLDEAKTRANEYLLQLPTGSRYTILPMCSFSGEFPLEPYRTREDAQEALAAVGYVDRPAQMSRVLDLVKEALDRGAELPTKRVILVGDQQQLNWPQSALERTSAGLPDAQIVRLSIERPDNAWIAEFRVQDSLADVETSTLFVATVGLDAPEPRSNVPVTLSIDDTPVATRTIDLEPGQTREVSFSHRFDLSVEPGKASYATASVSIPADRLNADDARYLVVPVVAAVPVVFVDDLGSNESPQTQQYGETYRWRRLLAPVTTRGESGHQLITIRHVRIDQVDRELLKDARLVVIAGVENPEPAVEVLREFVAQGGQLIVAAGGRFDANAWTKQAWRDGLGILPLPLKSELVGVTPEQAVNELKPFYLEPASLVHDYFQIDELSNEDRADLFRLPLFFKTAAVDVDDKQVEIAASAEIKQQAELEQARREAEEAAAKGDKGERNKPPVVDTRPHWLLWADSLHRETRELTDSERQAKYRPRVIARFTNQLPYLVERSQGEGHVLFVASGVQASWNTLMTTNAALLFDRIFRERIEQTLPVRNFGTIEQVLLPVEARERQQRFTLTRPGQTAEPLWVDALGGEAYALPLRNLATRGIYRIRAERTNDTSAVSSGGDDKLWEVTLAVNGDANESQLKSLTPALFAERAPNTHWPFVERGEPIRLAGASAVGQDWWRWLMLAVFVLLLTELAILAYSQRAISPVRTVTTSASTNPLAGLTGGGST